MKRFAPALLAASLTVQAAVAQETKPAAGRAATTRPAPKLREFVRGHDGSPVLAAIGDRQITQLQIDRMIPQPEAPLDNAADLLQQYRQQELGRTMWRIAYDLYLADHPGLVTPQQIEEELGKHEARLGDEGKTLDHVLASYRLTRDEYAQMAVVPTLLEQSLRADDKKAEEFYNAHKDGFDGTKVVVRHIMLRVDTLLGTPEEEQAAQMKLGELSLHIGAGVVSFDEAMKEHSDDPNVYRQPEMKAFPRYGPGIPETFAEAAFSGQPGDTIGPVRSNIGWHLIQVVRREPGKPLSFAEAKALIQVYLMERTRETILDEVLAKHAVTPYMIYQKMPRTKPPATAPARPPAAKMEPRRPGAQPVRPQPKRSALPPAPGAPTTPELPK